VILFSHGSSPGTCLCRDCSSSMPVVRSLSYVATASGLAQVLTPHQARGAVLGALSSTNPQFAVPLELRETLGVPHSSPVSGRVPRSKTLQDYAHGLTNIEVPAQLSVDEAASLFDVWMKDHAVHGGECQILYSIIRRLTFMQYPRTPLRRRMRSSLLSTPSPAAMPASLCRGGCFGRCRMLNDFYL
jgi:hypothetical protein